MLLAIGFGAAAFGKRFRLYSIATFLMLLLGGVLTGLDQPRLAANLPTPWMGVWERISISLTRFGSWYWPSLSYAPKWNGSKMTSMGEVILDELGLIARHAV
jgi:hypothetical protein